MCKILDGFLRVITFGLYKVKKIESMIPYKYNKEMYEAEQKILLDLINNHRSSLGLPLVVSDKGLTRVSKFRALYQISIKSISHKGLLRAVKSAGITTLNGFGENLGFKYRTSKSCFNAWLRSKGHRRLIENSTWTACGISILMDNEGRVHYVLIMGY